LEAGDWSALHPGYFTHREMKSRNALHRRLSGSLNQSGYSGEEKTFLFLPGIKRVHPTHGLINVD